MELNSISFPLKPGDPEYKETCTVALIIQTLVRWVSPGDCWGS